MTSCNFTEPQRQALTLGLQHLGITPSDSLISKLDGYLNLILQWNPVYNLTAITDRDEMIQKHLLDSLAIVPYLQDHQLTNKRFCDVGSGMGCPGLPLALACPDVHMTLLDKREKRTAFLHQVVQELGMSNVSVQNADATQHRPNTPYDVVISRATADIDTLWQWSQPWLPRDGQLIAMVGHLPEVNFHDTMTVKRHVLDWPGRAETRHAVVIQQHD